MAVFLSPPKPLSCSSARRVVKQLVPSVEPCVEKWLSLRGFNYSYKFYTSDSFRATPVFFISGAFQSMKSWKSASEYLFSRDMPVILADLPGTGCADPLPSEYGLDFLADAIRAVIDDIGVDQVSIVSASYGTPIAYTFAARNPDLVSKLILAGTMKEVPAHMKLRVADTLIPLRDGRMDQFAREVAEGLVVMDPEVPVRRRDLAYRLLCSQLTSISEEDKNKYILNTLRILNHESLYHGTPPQCPSLVYTGEHDSFTTPEYCLEIANSIADCLFTTINEADHMFHIERPSVVNDISYEFLKSGRISSLKDVGPVFASGYMNSTFSQASLLAA